MFVEILRLGEEEVLNRFSLGAHILGRGPVLQCNDKRVSRNHATLEVTQDHVRLTSIHVNPCFLKAAESKTLTILSKDSSTQLNNGDSFAFLPEDYWFKIQIVHEDLNDSTHNDANKSDAVVKRPHETCEEEVPPDKKIKIEENAVNEEVQMEITNEIDVTDSEVKVKPSASNKTEENEVNEVQMEITNEIDVTDSEVKVEPSASTSIQDEEISSNVPEDEEKEQTSKEIKKEDPEGENPSTSSPRLRRERCWYGAQCYRKNPAHREEFTHPGDSDFESDPEDNRPTCSYGASCYRKNKDHRRNYKHPSRQPPGKKKRSRKKVQRLNVADSQEMRELDSDSEEDPFVVSDDSEEYEGESDDDETDWEDSQNADEDSENVKRLVKEAKKFVNK
ncbi:aprataxin and PNK-like factor [Tribolium madens]|uniref:aprataxin and PNK-like factor n=1 Tax=Tribolium madens TaxID=41895 RepID=UPI001CF73118|nr:aprataxin and PNK-like factor [Tribolium madens]XP_044265589.1 aprataxin and PNK-like factor [Tribolium madens]XP_044265590.1 aprataxin and PNK-like factor [Tribolium madens]XP_044265591.1 aprataxin and PNK-like factor [Tribolium madens]